MTEEYEKVIEFLRNQSEFSKEKANEITQEVLEEKKFFNLSSFTGHKQYIHFLSQNETG